MTSRDKNFDTNFKSCLLHHNSVGLGWGYCEILGLQLRFWMDLGINMRIFHLLFQPINQDLLNQKSYPKPIKQNLSSKHISQIHFLNPLTKTCKISKPIPGISLNKNKSGWNFLQYRGKTWRSTTSSNGIFVIVWQPTVV